MSPTTRRTIALGGTLLVLGTLLTAPTAAAVPSTTAASACKTNPSDNTCDGVDPQTSGCAADAYTVSGGTATGPAGTVELRYSPSCKTNWGRVLQPNGNITVFVIREDGASRYSVEYNWPTTPIWSPMLYAPVQRAQAGYDWHCCDSGGDVRTPLK